MSYKVIVILSGVVILSGRLCIPSTWEDGSRCSNAVSLAAFSLVSGFIYSLSFSTDSLAKLPFPASRPIARASRPPSPTAPPRGSTRPTWGRWGSARAAPSPPAGHLPCFFYLFINYNINYTYYQRRNWISASTATFSWHDVIGGAATYSEGFLNCFLKVPLACLGSMAAAVLPNSLGNSQKKVYKTFRKSCRPAKYGRSASSPPSHAYPCEEGEYQLQFDYNRSRFACRNRIKQTIGAICWDLRSRSINIHDKQEKNPSGKPEGAQPPRGLPQGIFSSLELTDILYILHHLNLIFISPFVADVTCWDNGPEGNSLHSSQSLQNMCPTVVPAGQDFCFPLLPFGSF